MSLFRRRPRTDDQAPAELGTWTCTHCDQDVPITGRTQIVLVFDPTDVEAHMLTHPGKEE